MVWVVASGALLSLGYLFAFCSAGGGEAVLDGRGVTFSEEEVTGEPFARTEGRLSTRDALAQARRAQEAYFEEQGTYTTDYAVLTAEGFYVGVELNGRHADEDGYCVDAKHDSGVTRHITQAVRRAQRGPCP